MGNHNNKIYNNEQKEKELDKFEKMYNESEILEKYEDMTNKILNKFERLPLIREYSTDDSYKMKFSAQKYACGQYIKYAVEYEKYKIEYIAKMMNQSDEMIRELMEYK